MRLQVIGLGECEYGRNQNPRWVPVARAAQKAWGSKGSRGVEAGGGSCLEKAVDRHCESDSAGAMETQRCSWRHRLRSGGGLAGLQAS